MFTIAKIPKLFQNVTCSTVFKKGRFKSKLPIDVLSKSNKLAKSATKVREEDAGQELFFFRVGSAITAAAACFYAVYKFLGKKSLTSCACDIPVSTVKEEELESLISTVVKDFDIPYKLGELHFVLHDQLSYQCKVVGAPHRHQLLRGGIGLPYYLSFSSPEDVRFSDLRHRISLPDYDSSDPKNDIITTAYITILKTLFKNQDESQTKVNVRMDLSSLQGSQEDLLLLKDTFVLSESGKKFLIASGSMGYFCKIVVLLSTTLHILPVVLFQFLIEFLHDKTKLPKAVVNVRHGFYLMAFGFALCFARSSSLVFERSVQENSDLLTCKIGGKEYAEGGIEVYEKTIQRVKLLRKLLPESHEYFNEECNLIKDVLVSIPPITIQERLQSCVNSRKKFENEEEIILNSILGSLMENTITFAM